MRASLSRIWNTVWKQKINALCFCFSFAWFTIRRRRFELSWTKWFKSTTHLLPAHFLQTRDSSNNCTVHLEYKITNWTTDNFCSVAFICNRSSTNFIHRWSRLLLSGHFFLNVHTQGLIMVLISVQKKIMSGYLLMMLISTAYASQILVTDIWIISVAAFFSNPEST